MLENVKNLVSHDKGKTFTIIKETLKELGYSIHFKVLDGQHFVPQHRERIIIVGFNNKVFKGKENFEFPKMGDKKFAIRDILESKVDDKYTLSDKLWN
jgi:DNA (cytosine-5)-methyltransferase 1